MLKNSSILVFMYHSNILLSFNKCTLCKSLWKKASAKCPNALKSFIIRPKILAGPCQWLRSVGDNSFVRVGQNTHTLSPVTPRCCWSEHCHQQSPPVLLLLSLAVPALNRCTGTPGESIGIAMPTSQPVLHLKVVLL